MHARVEADTGDMRLKMKNRIDLELRNDWVNDHPTLSYWMDKEKEAWGEAGIEFSMRLSN
jgi:exopolyphosphatase/guanosine-5'-triphosphate,3'-diphosphate pyrophosphatase